MCEFCKTSNSKAFNSMHFGAKYTGVTSEIREALAANDFEHAPSLVHNLKGLAGNLSAIDLQAASLKLEKLVQGVHNETPPGRKLNLKLSKLETALNQALESVQSLGATAEEKVYLLSDEEIVAIPAELAQDIAKRIRDAAEMGDVMVFNAIVE